MRKSLRTLLTGVLMSFATIAIGMAGYMLNGESAVDAFYMIVITVASVGYGEVVRVDTPALKLFTSLIIIFGTVSFAYIMAGIVQTLLEGELQAFLGERAMTKSINNLKRHTIICGYGRMGQILAKELESAGQPFVVVDKSEGRTKQAEAEGHLAWQGDASEEECLLAVHVERALQLATVLPDDAANVFITLTARTLNENLNILSRGEVPATRAKLIQAGANHVILPAAIGGYKMAELILQNDATREEAQRALKAELGAHGMRFHEVTLSAQHEAVGRQVHEVFPQDHPVKLVAIEFGEGARQHAIAPTHALSVGDTLLLVAPDGTNPFVALNSPARDAEASA